MRDQSVTLDSLFLYASLVLCVLLPSLEAQGQAPRSKHERIEALLYIHDGMPTRGALETISSDAKAILFDIANRSRSLWLRTRAMAALGLFLGSGGSVTDSQIWELYESTLRFSDETSLGAHRCLQLMSAYFPERMGATLRVYLRKPKVSLRHTALSAFLRAQAKLPSTTRTELFNIVRMDRDPSIRKRLSRWLLKQVRRPSQGSRFTE